MLAGLVPSEGCEGNLLLVSLHTSHGLLAIFGIPWLVEASSPSLPSSSLGILLVCISAPKLPLFNKDASHTGLGAHPFLV